MGKKLFMVLLLFAFGLHAHAPKAIELAYDAETATLSVKVLHKVSNQEKHFIKRIAVYAGKELLAEKTYERQETADGQDEIIPVHRQAAAKGRRRDGQGLLQYHGQQKRGIAVGIVS